MKGGPFDPFGKKSPKDLWILNNIAEESSKRKHGSDGLDDDDDLDGDGLDGDDGLGSGDGEDSDPLGPDGE